MSEEDVDNHVLRKYSLVQKLGKGVSCASNMAAQHWTSAGVAEGVEQEDKAARAQQRPKCAVAGVWSGLESRGQEEWQPGGIEKDL